MVTLQPSRLMQLKTVNSAQPMWSKLTRLALGLRA
jgi:hypothetical protein